MDFPFSSSGNPIFKICYPVCKAKQKYLFLKLSILFQINGRKIYTFPAHTQFVDTLIKNKIRICPVTFYISFAQATLLVVFRSKQSYCEVPSI